MDLALGTDVESAQHPTPHGQLFMNANSPQIHGGHFLAVDVINNRGAGRGTKDPFERLQEHVSTAAFHNSAMRADSPRCHQNTREAVMDDIFNWILQQTTRTAWILWLNGAAGAGKSAIGQSIAVLCAARDIPVASFFFFRTDPTRNSIAHVVATLAYQLIRLVPVIKNIILEAIESNPLIFQQSFETQLEELIFGPLSSLQQSHLTWRMLIIVDGIDECNEDTHQVDMVRTIAKLLRAKKLPLLVLFSSRPENRFKMVFHSPKVGDILQQMPLDEHYLPETDIRLFLRDSFAEIKESHPFSYLLDYSWPEPELLEEIVQKSSGQFIYASVVMKFISIPETNPNQQLEIVRGLRLSAQETPFAELDALYQYIFSCVQNIDLVTSILAYVILGDDPNVFSLARLIGLPQSDLNVALAALTSVVSCKMNEYEPSSVVFLHGSLPDFLLDKTRSGAYHIDSSTWSNHFLMLWFQKVSLDRRNGMYYSDNYSAIIKFLTHTSGSEELRQSVLNFTPSYSYCHMLVDFVTAIQKINFGDEGEAYRHQLAISTRFLWNVNPALICPFLDSDHDVFIIMSAIERDITEMQDTRVVQARHEAEGRQAKMLKLEKQEITGLKTALREFDEQERERRLAEKAKYDREEEWRRAKERTEFDTEEAARRAAAKAQYDQQEAERRDQERKEYDTAETARRDAEMREFYLQEGARREEWRRQEDRKEFEEHEQARRDAARKEFDRQEEERREVARREFDKQEAARRSEAAQQESETQEEDKQKRKASLWARFKGKG